MIKGTPYLIAGLALFAGGCGYPYYWEVEIEDHGSDYWVEDECSSCDDETLYVEVRWDTCTSYDCVNLDLELKTPEHDLIVAGDEDYYGCTHFGDDRGEGGSGFEEIVCVNPSWGEYEIQVVSLAHETVLAEVAATYTTGSWSHSDVYDFSDRITVPEWGVSIVPFELP